jgi:hypothetical protein
MSGADDIDEGARRVNPGPSPRCNSRYPCVPTDETASAKLQNVCVGGSPGALGRLSVQFTQNSVLGPDTGSL